MARQVVPSHAEVFAAIDGTREEDKVSADEEAAVLVDLGHDEDRWTSRPRSVAYCAVHEAAAAFYIAELKNADGECEHFEERKPARPADCARCRHLVSACGDEEDAAALLGIAEAIALRPAAGAALRLQYERIEKGIGPRKSLEVKDAFRNYGWLTSPPHYLAWCGKRKEKNRYAVAECINMERDCRDFTAR